MKIIVAEGTPSDRHRICELLRHRGHSVAEPATAEAVLYEVQSSSPEVALVDLAMGAHPGAMIRALRAGERDRHLYLIALLHSADARSVSDAWSAGADDLVRKSACADEIAGRVEAPVRIASWAAEASRVRDFGAKITLERLAAWQTLESIALGEISSMLGAELCAAPPASSVTIAAEIPISLPSERIEIRLSVGLDASSVAPFAQTLFDGPAPDDVVADALREIANTASGAFKRVALAQGATFTVGLPSSCPPFDPISGRRFALAGRGFQLTFLAREHVRPLQQVLAHDLCEGMVLAHDVKNSAGLLLLGAGTALTRRGIERLCELVGPNAPLTVGDPRPQARSDREVAV